MLEFSGYLRSVVDESDDNGDTPTQMPHWFSDIVKSDRIIVEAAPGIFSVVAKPKSNMALERLPSLTPDYIRQDFRSYFTWGSSRKDYAAFCTKAIESHSEGVVLDIGGCSLSYSANAYVEECRSVVVVEHSISALKKAHRKVKKAIGRVPSNFVFLQADFRELPFLDGVFSVVLALGALNTVGAIWELVQHTKRVAARPGEIYMTSLALTGRWLGDKKLDALHKEGKLAFKPRTVFDLSDRLARRNDGVDLQVRGNVVYVVMSCEETKDAGDLAA